MSSNLTAPEGKASIGFYIIVAFSFLSMIISIIICLIILLIIYLTRNLHTPTNLLICNTCFCALLYSIILTANSILIYMPSISADWPCRIRGYLSYVTLHLVIYSYIIQAISRLFWTVLYKYRALLTNRSHIYLILSHFSFSFLIPSSTIITKDIVFRPFKTCSVSMDNRLHVFYLLFTGYILPLSLAIILYTIIYRHSTRSRSNLRRGSHCTKRDKELARNILILLAIFVFGGFPTIVYLILSSRTSNAPPALYILAVGAPSVSLAIEKAVTILLNKDIRKAIKERWISTPTRVQPFHSTGNTLTRTK